jgi:uncharacterized integral membrane protein
MNVFRLSVALLLLVLGLIVGLQNGSPSIELKLLWFGWQTTPGIAILLSLFVGVVAGAVLVLATMVWPLYAKLRKANKQAVSSGAEH